MTRKDYVAIAEAMKIAKIDPISGKVNPAWYKGAQNQWVVARVTIADVLAADNPRFDRGRFYRACEGEK